ncbi:alpha-amylase family glycosyl hydrolase [Jannaschia sp. S6380]|uniref:alpha-amylase family glycosyl hydrolase n=1 Tax=Jannaschia sp. S6380 TaxID=2926408 RepID=UPI001FF63D10|nr:alpha-amylase family glycosyl hydrolase [Jannaschia sp. S6380]MCK0166594.1 alpha-amylase family glycosyl hydrolase [Jannaschia sp. S6380]
MTAIAQAPVPAPDLNWWRGGVIYQIYPRSYQDTSGDGIGDLAGITERLPYVASLGVDAIWISPFFTSPMKDFGYDVSDYRDVDPMFGTLGDFDMLIAAAHRLGIRVMIDLVLSHSSDQHAWFQESRLSRHNDKSDWYVWADPKPDGTAPNNWLSIFGGPAWQWDARRQQYYLHNFLVSQPDFNFHNPDVQDAMLDVTRFWLDRGVDGFRLDTINFYFADALLRDNPALPPERRNAKIAPQVNPYNHQEHIHSKNQPENLVFLKRFRDLLDEYPGAAAVGEIGDSQWGMELLGQYTREGQGVQMCYAFDFLSGEPLTATRVVEVFDELEQKAPDGWACWAFSNHDVTRHITRWQLDGQGARCYATLINALRGTVCLYQGEELGLSEARVAFEDLQDPYGIEFWPEFAGRDGCRTPMVWEASNTNGGFSEGRPWLPVAAEHLGQSVAAQEQRPDALLHHYRAVIAMRAASVALRSGSQTETQARGDVLTFIREVEGERIFCAFNLGGGTYSVPAPKGVWTRIEGIGGEAVGADAAGMNLGPWQYVLLRAD